MMNRNYPHRCTTLEMTPNESISNQPNPLGHPLHVYRGGNVHQLRLPSRHPETSTAASCMSTVDLAILMFIMTAVAIVTYVETFYRNSHSMTTPRHLKPFQYVVQFLACCVIVVAIMAMTGCATTQPEKPAAQPTSVEEAIRERTLVIDTACQWVAPIYIRKSDVLTIQTARSILNHNETWEANCKKDTPEK